jgi:hypothetical protein
MSFSEKLDEDLRSAFQKLGAMSRAKNARNRENTRHMLWAMLGDAKSAGQLDLNHMEEHLYRLFATYMGRMSYGRTAKAFLDFVQVLKGEESVPVDVLINALKGVPNVKKPSPNSQLIKTIMGKLIGEKYAPEKITKAVDKIDDLAQGNDDDKNLIFEYMRLWSQQNADLLNKTEYAKLIPYLDRELATSELKRMMLELAKNILRSKTVQELTGRESTSTGKQGSEPVSDKTPPVEKQSSDKKGQRISRGTYMHNLEELMFYDDIHNRYRSSSVAESEKPWANYWNKIAPDEIMSKFSDSDRINLISANIMSLMLVWNYPQMTETQFVGTVLSIEALVIHLNKMKRDNLQTLRLRIIQGETPEEIAKEFGKLYNTKNESARWLCALLAFENRLWYAKNKKPDENT